MNYVIESIRKLDGTPHEREARRKGHRVFINKLTTGNPLLLVYVDEVNQLLHTSTVTGISREESTLTVTTRNTIYTFRRAEVTPPVPEN